MKTKILRISLREREKAAKAVELAAKAILDGQIIAYPTETTYGLGADATNEAAVKKIFELKVRDADRAMPIIVSDLRMAKEFAEVGPVAEHLANAFMPGPLTLIVDKKKGIPDIVSRHGIAFRIPSNYIARGIASQANKPLIATSANISGQPPVVKEADLIIQFDTKVNLIIATGDLISMPPSTVVDVRTLPPKLLRQGPMPFSEIEAELRKFAPATP
jgi:L-threonylcarbamoyladenylate synthase